MINAAPHRQSPMESMLTDDNGIWRVRGDLSFSGVARLARQARVLWNSGSRPTHIDLAAVRRADSAGLALLIQWHGWQRDNAALYSHIPEQIQNLAELHGVDALLTADATAPAATASADHGAEARTP